MRDLCFFQNVRRQCGKFDHRPGGQRSCYTTVSAVWFPVDLWHRQQICCRWLAKTLTWWLSTCWKTQCCTATQSTRVRRRAAVRGLATTAT